MTLRFLGLFAFAAALSAQPVVDPLGGPAVRASLVFLSLDEDLTGLALRGPEGLRAIEVPSAMRSRPVAWEGPATLDFVRLGETLPTTPEEIAALPAVARAVLPAEGGRRLLLFLRNPAPVPGAPEFGVMVVSDDNATLPLGHYRVINGATKPLGVALGDARIVLEPGHQEVVDPKVPPGDYVDLLVLHQPDATWELLFSSRQLHSTRLRYLMFLAPLPGEEGRLSVKVVPDLAAP